MRIRLGAAMIAAIALVACSQTDPDRRKTSTSSDPVGGSEKPPQPTRSRIAIPAELPSAHRIAAEQARDALLTACAAQPSEWDAFKEVSLTTHEAFGYLKNDFDWELAVTVTLVFKEGLDRRRGGHRIAFEMGAGNRPGIVTAKSQAIEFCGFAGRARGVMSGKPCDPEAGEDCILDLPVLKSLDAARKPAVLESQRTAPVAWCFGHGFDPPQYWSCASTEKACKRARADEKRDESGDYKIRTNCDRTESLHCFTDKNNRTVCAPDGNACATSRKDWTNLISAGPCEVATPEGLAASNKKAE